MKKTILIFLSFLAILLGVDFVVSGGELEYTTTQVNNVVSIFYDMSDPGEDAIAIWDDSSDLAEWGTFSDGITYTGAAIDFDTDYFDADSGNNRATGGSSTYPLHNYPPNEAIATNTTLSTAQCGGSTIYATAAITLTLPDIAGNEYLIVIADGSNVITITADGTDSINLGGTVSVDGTIVSDGTDGATISLQQRDSSTWWINHDGSWSDS